MEEIKVHDVVDLAQRFFGEQLTKDLVKRVRRLRATESARFWDLHSELETESLKGSAPNISSASCIVTGPQILTRPEAVPRVPLEPYFLTSPSGKRRLSKRRLEYQQFYDRSVV